MNKITINDEEVDLSNSQAEGLIKLDEWYRDKTKLIFTLYGAAGTGKTTLLNKFLKEYVKHSACVTAPTHKATRVVERITGRRGKTLQSLHGFRPNFNLESFNIDNITFESLGNIYMANYKLVIVDECSQINTELQKLNEQRSKQFTTKILYTGDSLQLPPINQRVSETFNIKNKFELTDIVRQEDTNPLLSILAVLRNDMMHNKSHFIYNVKSRVADINDKDEGFAMLNRDDFKLATIKSFMSDEFKENVDYCRYAAWTNDSVLQWNKFIRNIIISKPLEVVYPNDLITGYRTIVDEFNTPVIINSEDYKVVDCSLEVSDYGFEVYTTLLKNIHDNTENIVSILNHLDAKSMGIYYKEIRSRHLGALYAKPHERGKKWRWFYAFKDRYLVLTTFPIYDIDEPRKIKTWIKKDIDYGYGLTIHKLQGSTIDNIYLNMRDVCYYQNDPESLIRNTKSSPYAIELRNKLIYTALSRSKNKAIMLF